MSTRSLSLFFWKASSPSNKRGKTSTNHPILSVSVKEHENATYIGLKSWQDSPLTGTGFLQINPDVNVLKSAGQATKIAQIPGNLISKGLERLFNVGLIAFPALETLLWLNENLWDVATDPSN